MSVVHFLLPGDLDTPTGGYRYDRKIIQGLPQHGLEVRLHHLDESFPAPTPAALQEAAEILATIPAGAILVIDGLAYGPLLELLQPRHQLVALIHHPLASETGLNPRQQQQLREQERQALQLASRIIVTSPATARELRNDYAVHSDIAVVLPGTDRVADLPTARSHGTLEILCVATVVPRKGHALLVEALAPLAEWDWKLNCVGSLDRHPACVADLRHQLAESGLAHRITLTDAVPAEALEGYYRSAGLFILPSYHEGYGMVLAEALSFGLPIISTTAGAIPDTVPDDAGILVPPGNSRALHQALALLVEQPSRRLQMAAAARQAAEQLPDWDETIKQFAAVLPGECHG